VVLSLTTVSSIWAILALLSSQVPPVETIPHQPMTDLVIYLYESFWVSGNSAIPCIGSSARVSEQ
jgi:hypothetical protein